MRQSDQYQEELTLKDDWVWMRDVTLQMQREVLTKFGFGPEQMDSALKAMRAARGVYKDDPEMNKLTVYMRHDRSRKGELIAGSSVPDATLFSPQGTHTTLSNFLENRPNRERPYVIMAGSMT